MSRGRGVWDKDMKTFFFDWGPELICIIFELDVVAATTNIMREKNVWLWWVGSIPNVSYLTMDDAGVITQWRTDAIK